jgi:hypothetical protein
MLYCRSLRIASTPLRMSNILTSVMYDNILLSYAIDLGALMHAYILYPL